MKNFEAYFDEYRALEFDYDNVQAIVERCSQDNKITLLSEYAIYSIKFNHRQLLEVLIKERQLILTKMTSLKKAMAEEMKGISPDKQLKLL